MKCPHCDHNTTKVADSRRRGAGWVSRKRICSRCKKSFRTSEVILKRPLKEIQELIRIGEDVIRGGGVQ